MDFRNKILQGNTLDVLKTLPEESVQCCITSPPYWNLRDYGTAKWEGGDGECDHLRGNDSWVNGPSKAAGYKQIQKEICSKCGAIRIDDQVGLEKTPEEYISKLVEIFREIRRVLRNDGVLWLNLGDSYFGSWGNYGGQNRGHGTQREIISPGIPNPAYDGLEQYRPPTAGKHEILKPKDLSMIPARVAIALQSDGWWLRSQIPWIKKNCMPGSQEDRPTTAVEYVYLLSKSQKYFYDSEAVKSTVSKNTHARISQDLANQVGSFRANGGNKTNGPMKAVVAGSTRKLAEAGSGIAANKSYESALALQVSTRSRRNSDWFFESWQGLLSDDEGGPLALIVNPQPFKEAHFATFPPKLVEPMILAGTSEKGCCEKCGSPWKRISETDRGSIRATKTVKGGIYSGQGNFATKRFDDPAVTTTLGWEPTCKCNADVIPCTILDPFIGSGTTGVVAKKLGRDYIGIDLSPDYIRMAERRVGKIRRQEELELTG